MNKLGLTSEQKHDISIELNASDFYETVPFLNHVLKVLGYVDYMENDSEREELRWMKRKEPLIEDEKIRKAVRAWAEGNMIKEVQYDAFWRGFRDRKSTITVWKELPLEDNKAYTIAELCGEEEHD